MIYCITSSGKQTKGDEVLQTEVGINVFSAIFKGEFSFTVGRELASHWSLSGTSAFKFGRFIKKPNIDEEVHYNEMNDITDTDMSGNKLFSGGLGIKYWLTETYKGGYMMTGVRYGAITKVDAIIGCGYTINIWNGVKCNISYEIDIKSSILQDKMTGNGISLTLSYTY